MSQSAHRRLRWFDHYRAGYLRYPSELLRALEDSGYEFDSSVSAQHVLTNYPSFGFRQRSLGSEHSKIVVVPVTLDDSRDFLTAATQEQALRTWTEVIRANAENNAITCLLIRHTDVTYKLKTERQLIEAVRQNDIWIGNVGTLAHFWQGRACLRPTLRKGSDGAIIVALNLLRTDLPSGQALVVEMGPGIAAPQVQDAAGEAIPVRTRVARDRVFLLLP